jgi:hypothetical protein
VVLEGMAKGKQPSLLLVAVTIFGVVAAAAFGGVVAVPELVPPVELPPLEVVPDGGVVVPPEVLLVGGGVVAVVVLAAVGAPELVALLEPSPQALSAARQTIEIAGTITTRSFETKIIATRFHSLSCDHAERR